MMNACRSSSILLNGDDCCCSFTFVSLSVSLLLLHLTLISLLSVGSNLWWCAMLWLLCHLLSDSISNYNLYISSFELNVKWLWRAQRVRLPYIEMLICIDSRAQNTNPFDTSQNSKTKLVPHHTHAHTSFLNAGVVSHSPAVINSALQRWPLVTCMLWATSTIANDAPANE